MSVVETSSPAAVLCEAAYLRSDVKIEPLVDRWHAWPHLLAPAQQALNLAFRYLPIVRSFIAAPAVHAAASADPEMFGGPFLDLPISAVDQAATYITSTEARRAEALVFAKEIREFNAVLQMVSGQSLDDLRENLPQIIRGTLEIAYDLNNHPKMRLLEEMFEERDLGHSDAQELFIHRIHDVDRPFFLSTPRILGGGLFAKTRFSSSAAAALCGARYQSVDVQDLGIELGCDLTKLGNYFTSESEAAEPRYAGPGVRVRYFGHACLSIESREVCILIDPTAANDRCGLSDHFTVRDLPAHIDILFLSHGHQDHLSPEMLLQLKSRVSAVIIPPNNRGEIADPSLRRMLVQLGYKNVITLEPMEELSLKNGRIVALPFTGEHCDLDIHSKHCALVELEQRKIGIFVDTDAIDIGVYERLADKLRYPDLMFVGMECFGAPLSWLYGPLIAGPIPKKIDTSRRLSGANCQRARSLAELLRPRQAFVYAMGQEPWMRSMMGLNYKPDSVQLRESSDFVAWCNASGIPAERLNMHKEILL